MPPDARLASDLFPRASKYHPDWIVASVSGGANPLWLAEWLTSKLDLRPGMRVLDLSCGRAMSSIFLHREFGVQVWATDLWFSEVENLQRIRDAGCADSVFPIHADARTLPFAHGFFDAIVCIDGYYYFGTDVFYLNYLAHFVKPGGPIAIAGAGLMREIDGDLPEHLRAWWTPDLWSLHSAAWLRRHWERSGVVTIDLADTMPDGWQRWLDWHHVIAPDNALEIQALQADQGETLGYIRVIARRRLDATLADPSPSIPAQYTAHPLLREQA
jgi:SAM-dependent methyltransferase